MQKKYHIPLFILFRYFYSIHHVLTQHQPILHHQITTFYHHYTTITTTTPNLHPPTNNTQQHPHQKCNPQPSSPLSPSCSSVPPPGPRKSSLPPKTASPNARPSTRPAASPAVLLLQLQLDPRLTASTSALRIAATRGPVRIECLQYVRRFVWLWGRVFRETCVKGK